MTNESPVNARIAPNGNPFTSIAFFDVNSMYLDSFMKDLPLTPGLRWTKSRGNYFNKVHLSFGTSFKSLQYLYWLEQDLKMKGYDGVLQHAYHRGEKYLKGFKVDAYAVIDGTEVVYEFHGNCLTILNDL